jgi:hypothetical protein
VAAPDRHRQPAHDAAFEQRGRRRHARVPAEVGRDERLTGLDDVQHVGALGRKRQDGARGERLGPDSCATRMRPSASRRTAVP